MTVIHKNEPYRGIRGLEIDNSAQKLREGLVEIYRLATMCRNDMQGRLHDDEHRRAFDVLGQIMVTAGMTLGSAVD